MIVFLLMSYLHVFVPPDNPDMTYIKRVIGLPGETIEVRDGKVYANSVGLDNSFLKYAENHLLWIQKMNNIRACVREVVESEFIYS